MNLNLTGLRIVAQVDGETIHGVARVRYLDGHRHAGTYEVERKGHPPILAPWEDCLPGPNWVDTPEEHRFTGEEFYRPAFLDDTRREFLSASPGVVIPGRMDDLHRLTSRVKVGDTVEWYGHEPNTFRGTVTVASKSDDGITVASPKGAPDRCAWPKTESFGPQYAYEFEVMSSTLHFMRVPPQRTGKGVTRSLSLTFRHVD